LIGSIRPIHVPHPRQLRAKRAVHDQWGSLHRCPGTVNNWPRFRTFLFIGTLVVLRTSSVQHCSTILYLFAKWGRVDVTLLPVTESCAFVLFAHGLGRISCVFYICEFWHSFLHLRPEFHGSHSALFSLCKNRSPVNRTVSISSGFAFH